jgi:hypothetical protein
VVRGLVHDEHGRVREQQRRERCAHAPAARERRERTILLLGREPEPRQHTARFGLERVLGMMLELMLQVAGAREHGLEMRIVGLHAGQLLVQRIEFRAQVEQCAVRLHGAIEHGAVVTLGGLLRQVAHARAARRTHTPASGVISPRMRRMSVVLPAPFGPTSAQRSPGPMTQSTSSKRTRSPML